MTIDLLVLDKTLPFKLRDHDLIGRWCGHRECHIKPDVLLIYKRPDPKILRLAWVVIVTYLDKLLLGKSRAHFPRGTT